MSEHEDMMTRREVLERITQPMFRDADLAPFWSGYQQGLITSAGAGTLVKAAHELALIEHAEREEGSA